MVAQEFFSYVKTYGNSEGLTVKMDVGTPIARLRYKGVIIDEPSKLLILEDLYPPPLPSHSGKTLLHDALCGVMQQCLA